MALRELFAARFQGAKPRRHEKCVMINALSLRLLAPRARQRMSCRTSTAIRLLLLIAACSLICAIVVDQFPELLSLTDNTSNDFTIRKESFASHVLMLGAGNHSILLDSKGPEDDTWIRRPPTFEDGRASSASFLLLCTLRR